MAATGYCYILCTAPLSPLPLPPTVSGNKGVNVLECSSCKADLSYDMKKRVIAVDRTPEDKAEEMAAAAAKKAAAAAKKAAAAARKAAAAQQKQA